MECREAVIADPECSNVMYFCETTPFQCRCILEGQQCDETEYEDYQCVIQEYDENIGTIYLRFEIIFLVLSRNDKIAIMIFF